MSIPSMALRLIVALAALLAVTGSGAAQSLPSVAPPKPWLTLDRSRALTRIGVGSCLDQRQPQPIWQDVLKSRPELFLMIGDNVYGDVKGANMAELIAAYRQQGAQAEFAAARAAMPFLAIWDDHDFGRNDAGAAFEHAARSAALFHDFWQMKPERARGIHYARTIGPPGRRVQVIMLDTRSFRSPLRRKFAAFPHWGRYEPDPDPAKTMLGPAQWAWLEQQLRAPAEIRLLVSSVQVLAEGHGFERWGNLPGERMRLVELIDRTRAGGLVMLSGDRHSGAFYRAATPTGRVLVEMTASSLNRSYGPSRDTMIPPLISTPYHRENFGLVDIDWGGRRLALRLMDIAGTEVGRVDLPFADLGIAGE